MLNGTVGLAALSGWVIIILSIATWHYRDSYHHALDKQRELAQLAATRQKAIVDMQARQRVVADIDAKYTRELTDAKATINQLERSVIVGNQRLRINAICKPMSGTATPGATNATAPRLADAAQRNYFILIERVTQMEKQMEGLQEYVRSQCR